MLTRKHRPRNYAATLFASLLFLCAPDARAEDPATGHARRDSDAWRSIGITKNEPALFDGQLVGIELVISLGQKANSCDVVTQREVKFAKKLAGVDLSESKKNHQIDLDAWDEKEEIYKKALEETSSFWSSREWGILIGIGGTVAAILLADKVVLK